MNMYAEIEEKNHINQVKALLFALMIVGGIIVAMMFVYLYKPVPLPSDVLVELELGNPYAGGGSGGSQKTNPNPVKSEASAPTLTENEKDAPEINRPNNVNTKPVTSTNNSTKPNTTKPSNPNALFGGMSEEGSGGGNNNGDGKGDGGKKGDGHGPHNGPGTFGNGTSYLEGRTLLEKPVVEGGFNAEGKVVVDIWVDQNGHVIRTAINESLTNTSNKDLRDRAKRAAKRVVWNVDNSADIEQKGSVTINFKLH
ncbi:MAG TPA: hypothetical protein VD905_20725 [Flavobacteriales bacterium]|nr:hypothetical protein [Flavobacteriales bacterium]